MQCPNCQFENMPGLTACARCQSMLALGDVCVVPRRAARIGIPTALRRLANRIRNAAVVPKIPLHRFGIRSPAALNHAAIGWTIIPGLGHLRSGHRKLGIGLLAAWSAFLALALVSITTNAAALFLGLAVATHASAFISLFAENLCYERYIIRALFGVLLFLGLQYWIYAPLTGLLGNVYSPLTMPDIPHNDVVATGDGLLYEGAWLRKPPQHGDLVLYEMSARNLGDHSYSRAGAGVDRVIGLAGDLIEYRDGVFVRNGLSLPAAQSPLLPMPLPNFTFSVAGDHVVIIPSLAELRENGRTLSESVVRQLIEIPVDDVRGRVVFRLRPLARMGSVR